MGEGLKDMEFENEASISRGRSDTKEHSGSPPWNMMGKFWVLNRTTMPLKDINSTVFTTYTPNTGSDPSGIST